MNLIPTSTQPVTITLYQGVPFDNNYNEHTLLSTKFKYTKRNGSMINVGNQKTAFLDMKEDGVNYYFPRTTLVESSYNFAYGNGLVTSVVLEMTGNTINSNYMKVVAGSNTYYYFITGITQKNESIYLLNLELDVFMTYGEEFLDNLKNKPVMIERKHARRVLENYNGLRKFNPVCYNQESTFSQLKSNVIKEFTPLEFKDYISKNNVDFNDKLNNKNWIYIIAGYNTPFKFLDEDTYNENGVSYPYFLFCFPMEYLTFRATYRGTIPENFYDKLIQVGGSPQSLLKSFVEDSNTLKIIISPFPPFKTCTNFNIINNQIDIITKTYIATTKSLIRFNTGDGTDGEFGEDIYLILTSDKDYPQTSTGYFQVNKGYGGIFNYKEVNNYFETDIYTTSDGRDDGEIKLQISPFRDLRMSSYYGGEYKIPTQMLFLKDYGGTYTIKPKSIVSTNAESNSYYNYVELTEYSVSGKMGVQNSVAYNIPTGTSATELFNQTQSNQYENSKVVNAITNGLKVVGGALAVVFGGAMGKVGGATAIASGITGEVNTFTDWSAKMEDLKNTPNSYTFGGSSFSYDYAIAKSQEQTLLPYLITYGVSETEYNMGAEFLYHYGYEYNCESYFDTKITDRSDNIFERQMFNYVKIREDITTKLVGDNLPLIVAQKMNEVLNNGIKFWTFFYFDFTSTNDVQSIVDDYFQKSSFCNAELHIE